jgi:hypothetical protein
MKYLKKRRFNNIKKIESEDPLSGVANLFDIGLVFIVSLLLSFMTVYHLTDFFSDRSEITITKKNAKGELEIIRKKGKEIKAYKVTGKIGEGEGEKLGTAYRLKNGKIIYIPEK